MTKLSPHAGEIAAMRSVSGATTYDENRSRRTTKAQLREMSADGRKQALARSGMTIATGSLKGHTQLQAKRKQQRANRKAGRR